MEHLIANITGQTRYEELQGKRYLVAPMSLISPGVLNGSKGPLYYPADEVAKNPDAWNNVPIVVEHPVENGTPISARNPSVLNKQGIGFVFKSKANGKLTAEGWFDIEATERVDNRILSSLKSNTPIELSTGLFTDNEPAPEGAVTNDGKAYSFIARNYRPDHLAILPDKVGACSIKDGCGVLVNQQGCTCENPEECSCAGEAYGYQVGGNTFVVHHYSLPTTNEISHSELHDQLSQQLKNRFTQTDPSAWISDVFDTYIIYHQNDEMFKLGYSKKGGDTHNNNFREVTLSSDKPQKVMRETKFVTANQEAEMAKKELIDNLVANCDCWKEEDRKVLNEFSDEKLQGMVDAETKSKNEEMVANAAREGFEDQQGNLHAYDQKTGKWVSVAKEVKPAPTANEGKGKEPPKPQTEQEWLASAPAGIQSAVQNAMRIETEAKTAIVNQLVANVGDEVRPKLQERLQTKSLEELQDLQLLAPVKAEPSGPFYVGNAGGSHTTTTPQGNKAEPLELPTINWSEASTAKN